MNLARRAFLGVLFLFSVAVHAADDPLQGVAQLIFNGRTTEARAQIGRVRDERVTQSDKSGEAVCWLLLATADQSEQNSNGARANAEKAATLFQEAEDHFGLWFALWLWSEVEKVDGQNETALGLHERALALIRDMADPQARFSPGALKALGPAFGMPAENLGPLLEFPELVKPILLQFAEVVSRDAYGHALVEGGHLERAETELALASAKAAMFGGLFDSAIASHIGDLRSRQWCFEEARESYLKALAGVKNLPMLWVRDQWVEVRILEKLSELELLSGRIDEALTWNDRILRTVRESGNQKREASTLEDRGNLLMKAGRLEAALRTFESALKLAGTSGNKFIEASTHADMGALHFFQGNYGTALKHLEKSIQIFQPLNEPYNEAPIWALLAEVHMMLDADETAAHALENAERLAQKSNFKLAGGLVKMLGTAKRFQAGKATLPEVDQAFQAWWDIPEARGLMLSEDMENVLRECIISDGRTGLTAESPIPQLPGFLLGTALMLKGKMLMERGAYEQARTVWKQGLTSDLNRDHRAGVFALIGASYWREGKRDEAIENFDNAAKVLDTAAADVKVEELLASYLGASRRVYYDLLIEMLVKEGHDSEAFAQTERSRARAFLHMVGNHRFNPARGADPALVGESETLRTQIMEMEKEAQHGDPVKAAQLGVDLEGARRRYRALMIRAKVSNSEYAALTTVEPLEIDDVRAELPDDTTLLSYYVSPNFVHAWIIDRTTARHKLLPLDAAGLQRIVCWARQYGPTSDARGVALPAAQCSSAATAEEAYDQLIAPLIETVRHQRLVLVPHGVLHYVPFAALRDRTTGRYFIEDHTITYAPSASALRFLRTKETPLDGGALVLGDPESPIPLKKLPGARQEALSVANLFRTPAHIGAEARESRLYALNGKVDLVHLAAHGIYDPANPLFSRIALAGGDNHDGSLTVHEILSSVDLTGVNLVVLSACRSAVGARSGGDEVVGLTRALLYAGTPGVLSTLWNIDDTVSTTLMKEFYRELDKGTPAADAIRQAQLTILRSEQHRDPRFWAAFTMHGNPQGRWNVH